MKILHILDHSLPLHSGYTLRTREILRHQHALGWQTVQLTSPRANPGEPAIEQAGGLDFHRTMRPRSVLTRVPGLWPIAEMRATRERLDALVALERPDLLHAHSPVLDAWPAIGAGRRFGLPVVYEVRGFWEDAAVDHGTTREGALRYRLSRLAETLALRRADAVTAICQGLADEIAARGVPTQRITLIPNAVDAQRFVYAPAALPQARRDLGLGDGPVIGFLGSFYAYEGLMLLLDALPAVLRQQPSARLLLVGEGEDDARLRARTATLGLQHAVIYTGRVPNERIEALYDAIDVVAFPRLPMRLTELVTPLKPLEAMARGKPVVASAVGGHRELMVDERTGLLFEPGDRDALAGALLRLLDDHGLRQRLSIAGRDFVERERTWARSVRGYERAYAIAAERARRRGAAVGW
jgi:PEP-CTERM/exosortase A-associated glycosyltransferase